MPSNLTTGQVLPGFFSFVDFGAQAAGVAPTRRALLWGFKTSSGARTPNVPFLPASQQEADDGAGKGSDAANSYAAAVSQPESQGADVWVLPIAENSGGGQSTYVLTVFLASTNPSKAGTIQLWIGSVQLGAVGFTTTDTATTIGDAIAAAINANKDLPIASAVNASGAVTVTYIHKGTTGEDLPIRAQISPSAPGVVLSPAQAVFSGTAGADGSVQFTFGALTVTVALANGDTAAVSAGKVVAAFNANTYPVYAQIDAASSSTVDFLFQNNYDVRRMSAQMVTTTTQTVNLGSGAVAVGGGSTTNGTVGTGAPSLSAALANLLSLGVFRNWSTPWTDATSLGAMATQIEAQSDGSISGQKQQTLTYGSYQAASVAGGLATAPSPNLTTQPPHYAALWSPDAAVQVHLLAARVAAARAALWLDTPQKNWNGFELKGAPRSPLLAAASAPTELMQNSALRTYALAPVINGASGFVEVIKGRTTSLAADKRLWAWSAEAQAAFHAVDLAIFFQQRFQGGSLVEFSVPKTAGIFDSLSFKSAMQERMRFWESIGNYDGADALAPAVKASINVLNPNRVDVQYPESPVLDLDQVVLVGRFSQPSA
jgi:phage tail sheath gpL-like